MQSTQTMFEGAEAGSLDARWASLVKPALAEMHAQHVTSLGGSEDASDYVLGCRIRTRPGVYRPHPGSSSLFFLRALLREAPRRPLRRLLEVGTGSGAVSIGLLASSYAHEAVLTDLNPAAVAVARENLAAAGLEDRAEVVQSDLFASVPPGGFDAILFNLPLHHGAQAADHDPSLTDPSGRLACAFLGEADAHLRDGGHLWFTFSNLSDPAVLARHADKWSFELRLAEYAPSTGVTFFAYRAGLR